MVCFNREGYKNILMIEWKDLKAIQILRPIGSHRYNLDVEDIYHNGGLLTVINLPSYLQYYIRILQEPKLNW
jgi:hypothetical protein